MKASSSFVRVIVFVAMMCLVPLTLYVLYSRTGGPTSNKEMLLYKNLRFAFMAGTPTVDLGPLTTWPWVKVCAIKDGLSPEQVAAVIGFPYKNYDELHWLARPEYWTLLFIDSKREASWGEVTPVVPARIPRKDIADLSLPEGVNGLCVNRTDGGLVLARRPEAPVGTSPVTVTLGKRVQ